MQIKSLLIANRGEIALRVIRAARELGVETFAVYSTDDANAPHAALADHALALSGVGPRAYLDQAQIVGAARGRAQAIHPGYGFLSENAAFARAAAAADIVFIGPSPETLDLFGDKAKARSFASELGVPIPTGTPHDCSAEDARALLASMGPNGKIAVKALSGGGGRGIRFVSAADDMDETFERCRAEARLSFGDDRLYAEEMIANARHVEVQVVGDGETAIHLGERDCTLQRRNQKLVEIAPAPFLTEATRRKLHEAALKLATAARLRGVATIEFLLSGAGSRAPRFVFIEANPRIQVEHTITEEITGVDLVRAQIEIAGGGSLADLGLAERTPSARGSAIQIRVNAEIVSAAGDIQSAGGRISAFHPPGGPGVRIDSAARAGMQSNPAFDSLLAKLIVRDSDYPRALTRTREALREFLIEGVPTNLAFVRSIVGRPETESYDVHTAFVEEHWSELAAAAQGLAPVQTSTTSPIDSAAETPIAPPGADAVSAPMQGTVVHLAVSAGDHVAPGDPIAVLEAMKMEHVVSADRAGRIIAVHAGAGDIVSAGAVIAFLVPGDAPKESARTAAEIDLDQIRPDLAEIQALHAFGLDENRPEAVAKRRKANKRTARENIADHCDDGAFVEYGALAVAAQRTRRSLDDLRRATPADGLVAGLGAVNGAHFGAEAAQCAIMAYDFTVLAGTQGYMNHRKKDRVLHLARDWRLPTIIFTEGGGGRPGDTDLLAPTWLEMTTFRDYAALSGLVPRIAINAGYSFAGNAALVGLSDVVIATEDSSIGMGGPAMIEGGGLGVVPPGEVGPTASQAPAGVVDLVVKDEAEGVAAAKKYLAYFQGPLREWRCTDQRLLRHLIPESRMRVYDIRKVIETLADDDSVLELRGAFGRGMVTALVRIEGHPFGLIANDPSHLAGAIDADGADKAARFLQLCDAFNLPVISLCDTPGFMVGPAAEKTGLVRKVSRLFLIGAQMRAPMFTIVLRKGYGLGAQGMTAGHFHAPAFTVAWPTGEFGTMGLEGGVRLGFKKELEAAPDETARAALYQRRVAEAYEKGKASNAAAFLEIDAVIDPRDTRHWVLRGLQATRRSAHEDRGPRFVDSW